MRWMKIRDQIRRESNAMVRQTVITTWLSAGTWTPGATRMNMMIRLGVQGRGVGFINWYKLLEHGPWFTATKVVSGWLRELNVGRQKVLPDEMILAVTGKVAELIIRITGP